MYLRRQPQGYGINGNRVTKRMADLIGLKDISIDVNGSHNPMSLINCFCRAIEEPETDQVISTSKTLGFLIITKIIGTSRFKWLLCG